MEIKDRQGNIILSDKGQDNMLERLYRTVGGSIALKGLTAPLVSKAAGRFCDSIPSAKLIPSFIEKAGIDLTEYESGYYRSFNDFFTRKIVERRKTCKYESKRLDKSMRFKAYSV